MTYRSPSRETPPSVPPKIPLNDGRPSSTYINGSNPQYTRVESRNQYKVRPEAPYPTRRKTFNPPTNVNEEAKTTQYRVPSLNSTNVNGHTEYTKILSHGERSSPTEVFQKVDEPTRYDNDHNTPYQKEHAPHINPALAEAPSKIKRKSVSPRVEQHNSPTFGRSPLSYSNGAVSNDAVAQSNAPRHDNVPILVPRRDTNDPVRRQIRHSLPYPNEDEHMPTAKHRSWDNANFQQINENYKTSIAQAPQISAISPTHRLPPPPSPRRVQGYSTPPPSPRKAHRHPLPQHPSVKTDFTGDKRLSIHSAASDDAFGDYPLEQYGFSMPYGYDATHPLPRPPSPTSSARSSTDSLVAHYDTEPSHPARSSLPTPPTPLPKPPKYAPVALSAKPLVIRDDRHSLPNVPMHTSAAKSTLRIFDASQLSSHSFARCEKVWSLSCIADWLAEVTSDANIFTSWSASDALVKLFTFSIQALSPEEAQKIAQTVILDFFDGGVLEELGVDDGLTFTDAAIQGVFPRLANGGCYAPRCTASNELSSLGKCYSRHCSKSCRRTASPSDGVEEDWATFWHFDQRFVVDMDKQQVVRQNVIHEVILKEAEYVRDLGVIISVMQATLELESEKVFAPQQKPKFMQWVFGRIDAIYQVHMQHLLPQLQTRRADQGPIIRDIGDIFAAWLDIARSAYLAYAAGFPLANKLMTDARHNTAFAAWEGRFESDSRSQRLGVLHFLNRPNQRIGRYILLLKTVADKTSDRNADSHVLGRVIHDMEELGQECNARVGEADKNVALIELGERLSWRPGSVVIDLGLDQPQRKILRQGLLLRQSDSRLEWVESLVVLLDNFLLITKEKKDIRAPNGAWYYVSKKPIKLDHLVILSTSDEAERKSRKALGMGALTTTVDLSTPTSAISKSLSKTSSASSLPTPIVSNIEDSMEGIMFPLRIRHIGKDAISYTLYASSAHTRTRWGEDLTKAIEEYNKIQSSETGPFSVRVLADQSFGYSFYDRPRLHVFMRGGVVEAALDEIQYPASDRVATPVNGRISCATRFHSAGGLSQICIGTEHGIWCSNPGNIREWYKSGITLSKVTQMQVVAEMDIIVVLADKQLFSFDIEALWLVLENSNSDVSWTGSRVSPAGGVKYFAVTTSTEGRTLILIKSKRRDGVGSYFDVIEPIVGKAGRRGGCRTIGVDGVSFRDFDSYTMAAESSGFDVFDSTGAVHTTKGFEILDFASKRVKAVPTKSSSHPLLPRTRGKQAVRMFKIRGGESLLCYEEFAVYIDARGELSRPWAMEFSIRAKTLAVHYPYVVAFEQEAMEVLEVETGVSRQIITGVDVHCIDWHEAPIKFTMAHPTLDGRQLVCELLQSQSP